MKRSAMWALALSSTLAAASVGCGSAGCESADPDLCGGGGSGGGPGNSSILGDNPATFSEAAEASNGNNGEATGYTLEGQDGLEISGEFETGTPTPDAYVFNSGEFGGHSEPDFPGVDVRVFVDGNEINGSGQGVRLGLDTVLEHGYSSLSGDYFINAALFSGEAYVLRINPSASVAGKSYTIEVRGHVEETP